MRKTPKMLARAATVAVAVFFAAFAATPAFAAANLEVSQTEGLKDGTSVTISGTGFTPNLQNIAIGQCIEGMKGPGDCNTGGGSTFKGADASGNIAPFTLVVKEKFGDFDCTKQQCVFGAQPLPAAVDAATLKANTVYYDLSFGEVVAAPAPTEPAPSTPAPNTTDAGELPTTGAGETVAFALGGGAALLLAGAGVLYFTPRRQGGVA